MAPAGLPIVDAHQHFWDPGIHYYPWLCDEPPIAFRYGDYRALRRRYLPPYGLPTVAVAQAWLARRAAARRQDGPCMTW